MFLVLTQQRRSASANLGGTIKMAMSSNWTWVLDLYLYFRLCAKCRNYHRLVFILCATKDTKNIFTWYKS
jgi:hypothetical protein